MSDFSRFSTLWQALGAASEPQPVFDALARNYTGPQRAYHTLQHVRDCLAEFDGASMLAERPQEVEAALWLHDVVYDTRATDNEERSADWAREVLASAAVPTATLERVAELILATKHIGLPPSVDAALVVDIDLAILGREVALFERYEQQIQQEYAWVAEPIFREGRAGILEGFLARKAIYGTAFFHERYETRARENLSRSIRRLRGAETV